MAGDVVCLAIIASLAVTILLAADGLPRLALALLFVTAVPGWAFVRGTGLATTAGGAAMAFPASLAICAGTSTIMAWLGAWHPVVLFEVLAAASAAIIAWSLRPHLLPQLMTPARSRP